MIACCGLDCSRCEGYLATQKNDDDQRIAVAKAWSARYNADIKPEHINCDGCRSEGEKFFHTDNCEIRKCCMERNIGNCAVCDEYVCDKLDKFLEVAPEAKTALDRLRA